MKIEWLEFLRHNGAESDGNEISSFGNPGRELKMVLAADIFADLSHNGFIAVHGEDADSFLQGQFSNDIRQVTESASQLSSYSTPKGRMLAIFRVFKRGDTWYLNMPRELIDDVLKRLSMFVIRARVTLEDASETFMGLGVSGPEAATEIEKVTKLLPSEADEVAWNDQLMVARIPGPHPRYQIFGPLEHMQKCWDALNVRCAPVGRNPWELLDIVSGIPTIYPETTEAFVAQMANLQLINAVNFKKGCFPGQEIVARMQYLGKLKRRMYLARTASSEIPARGADLFPCGEENAQPVGKIVNCLPHPDGGSAMLAVLQIKNAESGEICVESPAGTGIGIEKLPYEFPEE